ncbi:hypothetical protein J3P71_15515 [Rhizobium leguminosarum]|uniref:hypothetical protein n=1 Tax=Rhizobium leguminosarum TaxID=384 RepID=UPI00144185DC|nr:hypothetical protein [Rhizobium leguminosarum]MBY5841471.1 hypothetical protein [Rhizobium leguminosarum]NKM82110.1 hypothetical protein [Rhizobium leguminosarum bv. viciae]QSZ06298.1 hypothetical protein J3P71_15515 [Rhizobium leguminosarum]
MPYFLDANCFKKYIDETLHDSTGDYSAVVSYILKEDMLTVDDEGIFVQEWKQTTGGAYNPFVDDLISSWLAEGRITLSEFKRDVKVKRKLQQQGIPSIDARIVEFCAGAGVSTIVSEDIDLYEPTQKQCSPQKRKKYVCNKMGSAVRFIRKQFHIEVTCCCHFAP